MGSMKSTTHLDHISRCETMSGTYWSNRWTYRVLMTNIRRDWIKTRSADPSAHLQYLQKVLIGERGTPVGFGFDDRESGLDCVMCRSHSTSLSSDVGTYETVEARFWPWREPFWRDKFCKAFMLFPPRLTVEKQTCSRVFRMPEAVLLLMQVPPVFWLTAPGGR